MRIPCHCICSCEVLSTPHPQHYIVPMNKLLQKDQEWQWKEEQQKAFDRLKARFTTNLILITADLEKPLRVESDPLNFATGAVLSMKCEDDKWRPCAFYLKSFNDIERNYDMHDKKMMGIIRALEAWRHNLEGSEEQGLVLFRGKVYVPKDTQLHKMQDHPTAL